MILLIIIGVAICFGIIVGMELEGRMLRRKLRDQRVFLD